MKMNHFYITSNLTQEKTAWNKAVADVEYFLDSMGFEPISIQQLIEKRENYLTQILSPEKKGMILLQYPRVFFEGFHPALWFMSYMKAHYGNYKITALLHDIDSIRYGDFFTTNHIEEVPMLNLFDYIITVNDAMSEVLKEHGALPKMVPLEIFDYALQKENKTPRQKNKFPTVAFAGNLKYDKSKFIYYLNKIDLKNTVINLYGPYLDLSKFKPAANVRFKGEFLPEVLPDVMDDDFGLCWEGNCLDHCDGKIGNYLKYSNPHKASFYLAMGIPVIISKDIQIAAFIEKAHVGVAISSLYELPEIMDRMTEERYGSMQENCLGISRKLRSGYYLEQAVRRIEEDSST